MQSARMRRRFEEVAVDDPIYDNNIATLFPDLSTLKADFRSMKADMRLTKWMVAVNLLMCTAILLLLPCKY
jgi:hypothetical protein